MHICCHPGRTHIWGKHFTGQVFGDSCRMMGIQHKLGAPRHPESQGQVERLINQVRCLCDNDIEKWPEAVARIQYSHNTSINRTTGMTPAELVHGFQSERLEERCLLEVQGTIKALRKTSNRMTLQERVTGWHCGVMLCRRRRISQGRGYVQNRR